MHSASNSLLHDITIWNIDITRTEIQLQYLITYNIGQNKKAAIKKKKKGLNNSCDNNLVFIIAVYSQRFHIFRRCAIIVIFNTMILLVCNMILHLYMYFEV